MIKHKIAWEQIIDVSKWQEMPLILYADIQLSPWGKIYSLLHRLPTVVLELKMQNGQQLGFRLIPDMAKAGFLLNPLLQTTQDIKTWYGQAQQLPKVQQIRLSVLQENDLMAFKPQIQIYIAKIEN